jgi:hypothetical protein
MLLPGRVEDSVPSSLMGQGREGAVTVNLPGAWRIRGTTPITARSHSRIPEHPWEPPQRRRVLLLVLLLAPAGLGKRFTIPDCIYFTIMDENTVGIVLYP